MANGIHEPSLTSIEKLLTGKTLFSVPIHQRSFDWGKDETEELWEDIGFAVGKTREDYFMGTIVLRNLAPEEDYDSFEIIDGQQRLTCISMIFSAVRNAFASRNDPRSDDIFRDFLGSKGYETDALPNPKITLNETNNECYLRYVIGSANQIAVEKALKEKNLHGSNKKLLAAYHYFLEKVNEGAAAKGTEYADFLVPLINCLSRRVKLIVIPVTDEEGAYLVFESVNARGKELAVSDLVKNRLYYEAGANQVLRAKKLWDQMEVDLGGRSIPEYLRHFWIAKQADSDNKVREKDLYRIILRTFPRKGRSKKAINLLEDLSASALDYAKISDYSLWSDSPKYGVDFKMILDELRLFRVTQCYPVLLNVIQRFDDGETFKAFQAIAHFSFRYNIVGSGTSGTLEKIFGTMAYQIRTKNYTSSQDIADELRRVNSDAMFRADFELAAISSRQSRVARYILAKIENHLQRQTKGQSLTEVDPDGRTVSLEHILPRNKAKHGNWVGDFGPNLNPADYVYRLGNLTLLTKKFNRDAADESFQKKQAVALSASELLIDEHVKRASKWSEKQIEQRQKWLAKYAVQTWKL